MAGSRYKNLHQAILDLEKNKQLIRIKSEVDPNLEMAEIHRRVNEQGGPALFFENVKGSRFSAVSNLFGTIERARFLFRDTIESVKSLVRLKADPSLALKSLPHTFRGLRAGFNSLPLKTLRRGVAHNRTIISELPLIKSWVHDGGAFITLPLVYTEDQNSPSVFHSNLGMYRIQLTGNRYITGSNAGMHYQLHRGIGIHHSIALKRNEPLKVSVFIGGPPSLIFSAVMPLPEGLPEVLFSGALGGKRFTYFRKDGFLLSAQADFVITGEVYPGETLPEGPFGDHLGYYSLTHDFPVLRIQNVYHKKNAIWPFTIVGRPPQEDSIFGELIHEITMPIVPQSITGLKAVHAVDFAGVHPLLLALGSERYTPWEKRKPQEILTTAMGILGFNQMSLTKYLFIAAHEDNPELDVHNIPAFLIHIFERIDFTRDVHFITKTTIDTLDYSGTGLNSGSKVIISTAGEKIRDLAKELPSHLFGRGYARKANIVLPGIVVCELGKFRDYKQAQREINSFLISLRKAEELGIALVVICDDADFAAERIKNFLWITFTRSNPSHDIYGAGYGTEYKHWYCKGPLLIDARIKNHHAPLVEPDAKTSRQVDRYFAPGGELHGFGY